MPSPLITLAADKLARDAKQLLDQLAAGTWKPAQELRASLDRYSELRGIDLVTSTSDSLTDDDSIPPTQRDGES